MTTELYDAVITYVQVTGADITEETKKITGITDEDVRRGKLFHEIYIVRGE